MKMQMFLKNPSESTIRDMCDLYDHDETNN